MRRLCVGHSNGCTHVTMHLSKPTGRPAPRVSLVWTSSERDDDHVSGQVRAL